MPHKSGKENYSTAEKKQISQEKGGGMKKGGSSKESCPKGGKKK
jgi:hypothetical protein